MSGYFISLEGGEGTGKSTQVKALSRLLESRGLVVHVTREPGGTNGAELIRELLLTGGDDRWTMRTEALLFAAARAEHSARLIRPALDRGEWVISDRYIDSSRAYQSVSGLLSDEDILALHRVGSEALMPHRTFVLDLSDEDAMRRARARDRGDSDRIGARDEKYHAAVNARFRQFAEDDSARVRLIDAQESVEQVTEQLLQNLQDLLS